MSKNPWLTGWINDVEKGCDATRWCVERVERGATLSAKTAQYFTTCLQCFKIPEGWLSRCCHYFNPCPKYIQIPFFTFVFVFVMSPCVFLSAIHRVSVVVLVSFLKQLAIGLSPFASCNHLPCFGPVVSATNGWWLVVVAYLRYLTISYRNSKWKNIVLWKCRNMLKTSQNLQP